MNLLPSFSRLQTCDPKPFFFVLDETSTIPYYDEQGHLKRYAPSKLLPNGEWAYCISPFHGKPSLKGKELEAHLALIKFS